MRAAVEPSIERLLVVARRLADLRAEVIFVGGAVTPLLVTDPAAPEARPTIDVDLVAPVGTYAEYHALGARLRRLGFAEDVDGPTGRWVIEGVRADVMPMRETQMHPTNPWYEPAMRKPLLVSVADIAIYESCRHRISSRRSSWRSTRGGAATGTGATISKISWR